jgi:pantothenate synthetase
VLAPPLQRCTGGYATYVSLEGVTDVLEGKVRPATSGRGDGGCKLVTVKPHVLLLGQKDGQQVTFSGACFRISTSRSD